MKSQIIPPLELIQEWACMLEHRSDADVFTKAVQWGSDQELEACCVEVAWLESSETARRMRERRRPEPPSLKEQALTALHAVATGANDTREQHQDLDTIRRALEALPND
jgi:hypothetical protein